MLRAGACRGKGAEEHGEAIAAHGPARWWHCDEGRQRGQGGREPSRGCDNAKEWQPEQAWLGREPGDGPEASKAAAACATLGAAGGNRAAWAAPLCGSRPR